MAASTTVPLRLPAPQESIPTEDHGLMARPCSDLFPPLSPFSPTPAEYLQDNDEKHQTAPVPLPEASETCPPSPPPRPSLVPRRPRCWLWSALVDYNHVSETFGDRIVQATCSRRSHLAHKLGFFLVGKCLRLRDAFTAFDFAAQRCARRFASPSVLASWEGVAATNQDDESLRKDSGYVSLDEGREWPPCCVRGNCGGAGSSRVQGPLDVERAELRSVLSKMAGKDQARTGDSCASSCYAPCEDVGDEQTWLGAPSPQASDEADVLAAMEAMEAACEGLRNIGAFLERCAAASQAGLAARHQPPPSRPLHGAAQSAESLSNLRVDLEPRVALAVSRLDGERLALDKVLDGPAAAAASFLPTPPQTWTATPAEMTGALQTGDGDDEPGKGDGEAPAPSEPRRSLHMRLRLKHGLLRCLTCLHIRELDGFVIRRYRSTVAALEHATDRRSTARRETTLARLRDVELSRWGRIGVADTMERKSPVSSLASRDSEDGRDRKGKAKVATGLLDPDRDVWRKRVMGKGMP